MFSDTLFGHVKGAFTGAETSRSGLVEQASGGILFLDEIGDLSIASQIKLLKLLQDIEYMQLGSDIAKKNRARIIVATNRDLENLQKQGTFRKDLFYRLNTHHVHVIPLRERKEDIPLLLDHLIGKSSRELDKTKPTPPPELAALLETYSFPGNIREFESMVFEAVNKHTSRVLSMNVFKSYIIEADSDDTEIISSNVNKSPHIIFPDKFPTLKETTQYMIEEAMRRAEGNQSLAARLLGISAPALSKRLKNKK